MLASLNHPNVAQIYGLEEAEGVKALVMELVEGPTLADRVGIGQVPLDEALAIAVQDSQKPSSRPTNKESFTGTSSPPTSSCDRMER